MRHALEGSQAIAQAVALCRPDVVAAYPITPQTHIVENISKLVANGKFSCEFVAVESEFSAASVVLGAALAGSRTYTASASQGILLMGEVIFDIAGMRLPVVMTCANRAVSAPLSIWNDHQDSMAVRDAGWVQIHCADNQEAVDTTIQAYRIAEATELPVMVCMDGFVLTHTLEPIDIPDQETVDAYLPPFEFARKLDPMNPTSHGTLVSPDYYGEVRHSHHSALQKAAKEIIAADKDWKKATKRGYGGLLRSDGDKDAKIAVLAMGSITGTLREALVEFGLEKKVKVITLRTFRPFPEEALQKACEGLSDVIVLDRALSIGQGGILGTEVRAALSGVKGAPRVHNYAVGLGGRDVPLDLLPQLVETAQKNKTPEPFRIFDADLKKLPKEDR